MAVSSLRVRLTRSFLTGLTIATATAFMMYLLLQPHGGEETDRQSWRLMLGLSLVVGLAGVVNAMLTSVAQRLREIGTIKCLGGLDSLILLSVLVEASLIGLAGSGGGVLLGGAVALGLGLATQGPAAIEGLTPGAVALDVALVLLAGMLLTTLGACVPAYVASKLPPIEAMRGEK